MSITASLLLLLVCCLFMPLGIVRAEGWYWLSSDSKYSKYFEPSSVHVTHSAETSHGSIATEITAWTKTTYSYEGAKETLDNYGLSGLIPDPAQLSYSLAEVAINPQNRTIQYTKEDFYNPQGAVIWSKVDGRVKEITSQQFDEAFYDAIVDSVFGVGEVDRASAKDRWLTLYSHADVDGTQTHVTADTTTKRMKGDNLLFWHWSAHTAADGQGTTSTVQKRPGHLPQGTERLIRAETWTPSQGWQDVESGLDGAYHMIAANSPAYQGLLQLRAYAKANAIWVHRYSIW